MTTVLYAQTLAQGKVIEEALKFIHKMATSQVADTDIEDSSEEVAEFKALVVQARIIQADFERYFGK